MSESHTPHRSKREMFLRFYRGIAVVVHQFIAFNNPVLS